MAKKKNNATPELNTEILVGFVNSFNFNDPASEEALGGHPRVGRLYQVIKDNLYGYRIHIGAENNPAGMAGILLGESLKGDHEGKWSFDIDIVTKDNFLNFNIHEEDTIKLGEWFETENKDLRNALEQDVKIVAADKDGNFFEPLLNELHLQEIAQEINEEQAEKEKRYDEFVHVINKIKEKDEDFFYQIVELVIYLGSTYSDKYEVDGKVNMGKEFLLGSKSPDTAIFNSFKYLQRYCTTGYEKSYNKKDLYKAAHYILFELQRRQYNGN